jgi:L-asparagine transporter-like permease
MFNWLSLAFKIMVTEMYYMLCYVLDAPAMWDLYDEKSKEYKVAFDTFLYFSFTIKLQIIFVFISLIFYPEIVHIVFLIMVIKALLVAYISMVLNKKRNNGQE